MALKVLSLFDGVGTGVLALQELGFSISEYHAFEILPEAIKVTNKHFPDVIHHGDVRNSTFEEFSEFDLVMGGSPCQNRSRARKENRNFHSGIKGEKSGLFWDFVRAVKTVKPRYFFLENVVSEMAEDDTSITEAMGVEPVLVNSNVASAQDRERLYWTNIPVDKENALSKEPCGLCLKDIMEPIVEEKNYYRKPSTFFGLDRKVAAELHVNSFEMCRRVYSPNFKCATLTCTDGGYREKKVWDNGRVRKLTPLEYERLQTLPDGWTDGLGICDGKRRSLCGNGWTKEIIKLFFKYITDET